jgi:hypothetical protein
MIWRGPLCLLRGAGIIKLTKYQQESLQACNHQEKNIKRAKRFTIFFFTYPPLGIRASSICCTLLIDRNRSFREARRWTLLSVSIMSLSFSIVAFISLSLILTFSIRQQRRNEGSTKALVEKSKEDAIPTASLTKEQVMHLCEKHFLKSVSVSYANSGPRMILTVS